MGSCLCYFAQICTSQRQTRDPQTRQLQDIGHSCSKKTPITANLYGRFHKCEFLKDKVDYLSFEVSKDGIHASPEKVKAVIDWPRPQPVHDIRSFWGLASYYRKFIKVISQLAKPLTDLTGDKVVWSCGDAETNSFTALKVAMATAPILRLPDFEKTIRCHNRRE